MKSKKKKTKAKKVDPTIQFGTFPDFSGLNCSCGCVTFWVDGKTTINDMTSIICTECGAIFVIRNLEWIFHKYLSEKDTK